MSGAPIVEFVNHSSFVLEYGGERLICDPWLTGTAFNRGWRLLSTSTFAAEDFSTITKIWFSHQHPDHFSPGDLRRIPPEIRAKIGILYQRTLDKKVVRYCAGLKFASTTELAPHRPLTIADGFSVECNPWPDRDSWLVLRAGDFTVLNMNDCVVEDVEQARRIARIVGPVDVLFTQFSYANWAGNPGDTEAHTREARRKLDQIRLQVEHFRPKYVVPFASFVWFSHEENFFHNAGMNQVGDIAAFIERELQCKAIVLYPADRWQVGAAHDSTIAVEHYAADFDRVLARGPADKAPSVALERIETAMNGYLSRIRRRNPVIGYIPRLRTSALLTDYGRAFEFTLRGMREISSSSTVDLHLSSDRLALRIESALGCKRPLRQRTVRRPRRRRSRALLPLFPGRRLQRPRLYVRLSLGSGPDRQSSVAALAERRRSGNPP